jgi:hypothetical protein
MGQCSNRSKTRSEKIAEFAKEVYSHRFSEESESNWQCSVGAKIRGELGIKKGNDFINAIKKANQ